MNDERGMKGYLPFASLVEQAKYIEEMEREKMKIPKPQISVEQARKINDILTNYTGEALEMKIFIDGKIYEYEGKILLNKQKKSFIINDFELSVRNIIDIESPNIFDEIC